LITLGHEMLNHRQLVHNYMINKLDSELHLDATAM